MVRDTGLATVRVYEHLQCCRRSPRGCLRSLDQWRTRWLIVFPVVTARQTDTCLRRTKRLERRSSRPFAPPSNAMCMEPRFASLRPAGWFTPEPGPRATERPRLPGAGFEALNPIASRQMAGAPAKWCCPPACSRKHRVNYCRSNFARIVVVCPALIILFNESSSMPAIRPKTVNAASACPT